MLEKTRLIDLRQSLHDRSALRGRYSQHGSSRKFLAFAIPSFLRAFVEHLPHWREGIAKRIFTVNLSARINENSHGHLWKDFFHTPDRRTHRKAERKKGKRII